jgi:ATP-dependent protease ClpP protease subunit
MAKEIRIYGSLNTYSADYFMQQMEEAKKAEVTLRINTDGGDPQASFGMIAKWKEYTGKKNVKVDGKAYSMGCYYLCYCEYAECLDVSDFIIHRAAMSSWYEQSEYMTPGDWDTLNRINKFLRAALEAKVNVKRLQELKGVTLDQIFSNETRIDVKLDAQEALEIGLINKINPITPEIKAEINSHSLKIAALYSVEDKKPTTENQQETKIEVMTLQEFKAKHPEVYAQIVTDATKTGVDQERERVEAWMQFQDIDAAAVSKGISEGKELSMKVMAEFTRKGMNADALKKVSKDNPKEIKSEEVTESEKTEREKNLSAFEAESKTHLGIK